MKMSRFNALLAVCLTALGSTAHAESETLDRIVDRGVVRCGVSQPLSGYTDFIDGAYSGFEVDYCRAIAVAIFNDPSAVDIVPLSARDALRGLQRAQVDVLTRLTPRSFTADAGGIYFSELVMFDTLRFLVRQSSSIENFQQLDRLKICAEEGSYSDFSAQDFAQINDVSFDFVLMETSADSIFGLQTGQCEAIVAPLTQLNAMMTQTNDPDIGRLLPVIVDDYQVSFATRHGDDGWADIVTWVINATILAEEVGMTQDILLNGFQSTTDTEKLELALLGLDFSIGNTLNLDDDWAFNVLSELGNYGEIYDRNLGSNSKNGSIRARSQLWLRGGMMYAPPLR